MSQSKNRLVFSVIVKYVDPHGSTQQINSYVEYVIHSSIISRHIVSYMEENDCQLRSMEINWEMTVNPLPEAKTIDQLFPLSKKTKYQCRIRLLSSGIYLVCDFLSYQEIEHWVRRIVVPTGDSLVIGFGKYMMKEKAFISPMMTTEDIEDLSYIGRYLSSMKSPARVNWSIGDW